MALDYGRLYGLSVSQFIQQPVSAWEAKAMATEILELRGRLEVQERARQELLAACDRLNEERRQRLGWPAIYEEINERHRSDPE